MKVFNLLFILSMLCSTVLVYAQTDCPEDNCTTRYSDLTFMQKFYNTQSVYENEYFDLKWFGAILGVVSGLRSWDQVRKAIHSSHITHIEFLGEESGQVVVKYRYKGTARVFSGMAGDSAISMKQHRATVSMFRNLAGDKKNETIRRHRKSASRGRAIMAGFFTFALADLAIELVWPEENQDSKQLDTPLESLIQIMLNNEPEYLKPFFAMYPALETELLDWVSLWEVSEICEDECRI